MCSSPWNLEDRLGLSLDELISLDTRGSMFQKLRAIDASLSPEDKLCMSLDDILAHSKAHTRSAREGSPGTCQRPRRRQITHLRRLYFPP